MLSARLNCDLPRLVTHCSLEACMAASQLCCVFVVSDLMHVCRRNKPRGQLSSPQLHNRPSVAMAETASNNDENGSDSEEFVVHRRLLRRRHCQVQKRRLLLTNCHMFIDVR
jgi:hypothetical protein